MRAFAHPTIQGAVLKLQETMRENMSGWKRKGVEDGDIANRAKVSRRSVVVGACAAPMAAERERRLALTARVSGGLRSVSVKRLNEHRA